MHSPKELFLVCGFAPQWKDVTAKEWFEVACQHAFAQFCTELPANGTPRQPMDAMVGIDANGQRMGALRVLEILQTLAEPIEKKEPPKPQKLNYA